MQDAESVEIGSKLYENEKKTAKPGEIINMILFEKSRVIKRFPVVIKGADGSFSSLSSHSKTD